VGRFFEGETYKKVKTDYKAIFFVATPIIEESVTIIPLRYVVDLGY
jgi:HrpA-like RNA helicase